jgi:histidyl-tRNA synthetase
MQGSNEKKPSRRRKPQVILKDLLLGVEIAESTDNREEYVAKQSEAQITVLEKNLVKGVQKILARHGVKWN